jgi:hypothetical protein
MIRKGKFAVEKVKYKDGVGCCIWYIIDEKKPDTGLCWDFEYKDLDTILDLLHQLKKAKPRIYKESK